MPGWHTQLFVIWVVAGLHGSLAVASTQNITTLIKAFGESSMLREMANLVLVMGNRTNIDNMAQGSQKVLDKVLRLVDAYDLYGSVAYPKRHESDQVTDIYRYAHRTRGVFVNIALQEPFGLTLVRRGLERETCLVCWNTRGPLLRS